MPQVTVTFEIEDEDSCEGCPCIVANSEGTHCAVFTDSYIFSMKRPDICKAKTMTLGMRCVNTNTTARLLGIRRETVWVWCKANKLRSYVYAGNKLIPLMDVAALLNRSQEELIDTLTEWNLPMWHGVVDL